MKRFISCAAILALLGYVGILCKFAFDGNFVGLAFWLLELFMTILGEVLDRKEEKQAFAKISNKRSFFNVFLDHKENIFKIETEDVNLNKDDLTAYFRGVLRWLEWKNNNLMYKH